MSNTSLNGSNVSSTVASTPSGGLPLSSITVIVYLSVIILIAVVANLLLIFIISRKEQLRVNVINEFIISLATSDILNATLKMTTSIALIIDKNWYPHYGICYVTTPFGVLFGAASVFNLCAVAINRYLVIIHPLHFQSLMTPTNAKFLISGLWFASVVISTPPIFWRSGPTICKSGAVSAANYTSELAYFISLWIFIIIIPTLTMILTYAHIFRVVRQHLSRINTERKRINSLIIDADDVRQIRMSTRKEARPAVVLALVGGVFICCWGPFFIAQSLIKFSSAHAKLRKYFPIFLCLVYSNSAINPIIITLFNKELRREAAKFLSEYCPFSCFSNAVAPVTSYYNTQAGRSTCHHRTEEGKTENLKSK